MIFFDISDTSIEAVKLSKGFFGESINAFARVELKDGPVEAGEVEDKDALAKTITKLLKAGKPRGISDLECGFTLPDSRVYTHRFTLPQRRDHQTVLDLVGGKMEKLIPQPLEELIYRFFPLGEGEGEGEVFMMAISKKLIKGYVECFGDVGLRPKFVVPESYAAFRFLDPLIDAQETILYLDIGGEYSNAVLMDKHGVVETFSEPVESTDLFKEVGKLLEFT